MPDLIHLNGPPAVGKSTLAGSLVRRRPLALNLDIDDLRTRLGGWQEREDSKQVARDLGFRLAEWHLLAGRDVVLPQLLVRLEVVEQLVALAARAGARFREVVLTAPASTCVERAANGAAEHPRYAFSPDVLGEQIDYCRDALLHLASAVPGTVVVDAGGAPADVARAVEAALDARGRQAEGA